MAPGVLWAALSCWKAWTIAEDPFGSPPLVAPDAEDAGSFFVVAAAPVAGGNNFFFLIPPSEAETARPITEVLGPAGAKLTSRAAAGSDLDGWEFVERAIGKPRKSTLREKSREFSRLQIFWAEVETRLIQHASWSAWITSGSLLCSKQRTKPFVIRKRFRCKCELGGCEVEERDSSAS